MFAYIAATIPCAFVHIGAGGDAPGSDVRLIFSPPPSPQTQTHLRSHTINHLQPFIDLAMNQLVNYLISKALWVSAELGPTCRVPRSL